MLDSSNLVGGQLVGQDKSIEAGVSSYNSEYNTAELGLELDPKLDSKQVNLELQHLVLEADDNSDIEPDL